MQGQELRKLITTFLVLALLAGSASLAINSLVRQDSEGPAAKVAQDTGRQVPKVGDKALVEDISTTRIEGYDLAAEFSPSTDPDDNYTDGLAKSLAYDFVKANPEGPDLLSGTGIMAPPNLQLVMEEYVTESALTPTTYAIDKTRLKIAKNYTPEQVGAYFGTLGQVFGMATSSRGIGGIMARSGGVADQSSVEATNFVIAEAQEQLYAAVVPAPAAQLHEAALTYFELNRKLTDLDYTTDPLKAAVFAAKFPDLEAREKIRLQAEAQNISENAETLFAGAVEPLSIASLLGINTAHALLGGAVVTDPKHTLTSILNGTAQFGTWSQILLDYARKLATQILKNQLVGRLIQQTVKWVQGGGKPQFITNWKGFLKESAIGATNEFISKAAPKLCQNLQAFTTDFLKSQTANTFSGSRDPYAPLNCTLDQIVQNVKAFYDDFVSGGWLGLAALVLQPQNNIWGSVIVAHEIAMQQAGEAQAAANADVAANAGYKGLNRCVNFNIETIPETSLAAYQKMSNYYGLGGRGCFSPIVPGGGSSAGDYSFCMSNPDAFTAPSGALCADVVANPPTANNGPRQCDVKMCTADGQQKVTPGVFVSDQVTKAVGGSLDNIVNAEDLSGLVAVLVDAAISKLTNFAVGGLLGLFGGNSDGEDPPGGGSGTGTSTTSTPPIVTPPADLASLRAQARQVVTTYETRILQARSSVNAWPATAGSVTSLLSSVAQTCTTLEGAANDRIAALGRISASITADNASLDALLAQIATANAQIAAATDAVMIADILASLDALSSQIATITTRVSTRTSQAEVLRGEAEANLNNRSCSTPLSTLDE